MKYCMDFVTNSSSGSTVVTHKACLQSVDLDMVRDVFGLKQPDEMGGTAVTVFKSGSDMPDISEPVKEYFEERGLKRYSWKSLGSFVAWFNKKYNTSLTKKDLLIKSENWFLPFGDSFWELHETVLELFDNGLPMSLNDGGKERFDQLLSRCSEITIVEVKDGTGATVQDYTLLQGCDFAQLVKEVTEANGQDITKVGLPRLNRLAPREAREDLESSLLSRCASLLYANGTHSVIWFDDTKELREFYDVDSLEKYLGTPYET